MQGFLALFSFTVSILMFAVFVYSNNNPSKVPFLQRPLVRKSAALLSVLAFVAAITVSPKSDAGMHTNADRSSITSAPLDSDRAK
ncbi:hypothetical protein [Paenibacillus sp. FJAT-26967]|uniref:hypothetical protein n=1 Tax=Paenibacillus sp. FJAT-26967 TaxID=1729690 RepID=UPI0008383B7A|nr:hypothetical protein [Paenibacillus sp. FJAT-26967]